MKNIYKTTIKRKVSHKDNIYKSSPMPQKKNDGFFLIASLRKMFDSLTDKVDVLNKEIIELKEKTTDRVQIGNLPDIQKVEIQNLPEEKEIVFPDVQKVEVLNPTPEAKPVTFPDVQKVEVVNHQEQKEVQFPKVQKVDVSKIESIIEGIRKIVIPVNKGNSSKTADPVTYIPVRLTDGEHFYKALSEMWVATGGKGGSGNPALLGFNISGQAKMNAAVVQLPSNKLLNGVILTAKSTNSAPLVLGMSGVLNTVDGTGNGYILEAGASVSFAVTNTNTIYVIGASNDVLSFAGS